MLNFDFYNPTHIIFGKNRLGELRKLINKNSKILILYGKGSVKKFGTLDKIKNELSNYNILEFGGIEPNPKYKTLLNAIEIIKKEKINFLLAVGGGSVIDGTKFINLAINYKGDNLINLLKDKKEQDSVSQILEMGTIITLPASSSEMNNGGVISYNNSKYIISNLLLFPKFSILDPSLTFTLPNTQVANGIIDTFVHVTEQYITYPVDARLQDRTAEGILQTLIEIGEQTIKNPNDYDTRANLVWCATMGLNRLIGCGVPQDWSTHLIGHELTAIFGIDHAKTLAILQPAIWTIRKNKKREKLIQFAERVWKIVDENENTKINLAIEKTRNFFEQLGVKTHLKDYGISINDIDIIIDSMKKRGLNNLSETGDLSFDEIRKILEYAM